MSDLSPKKNKKKITGVSLLLSGSLLASALSISPVTTVSTASAVESDSLAKAVAGMQSNLETLNREAAELSQQSQEVTATIAALQAEHAALVPVLEAKRGLLKESVKDAYITGEPSALEVLATNETFSGVMGQQNYREQIGAKTKQAGDEVAATQKALTEKLTAAQEKEASLASMQGQMQGRLAAATAQVQSQQTLLEATRGEEAEYLRIKDASARAELEAITSNNMASPTPNPRMGGSKSAPSAGSVSAVRGSNPYPFGQCTWYIFNRQGRGQMGNAGTWGSTSSAPAPGKVMIWRPGQMGAGGAGHVGVVESVNANGTVNVTHMNWNGAWGVVTSGTFASTGLFY